MNKVLGIMLLLLMVGAAVASAAPPAHAQGRIRSSGVAPFLYDNHAYVPVKSTCDYVGAGLTWDPSSNSATVAYHNRNVTLVVGTATAYVNNQPVALAAPVVMVGDQLYCPAQAFDSNLGVPMRWEPRQRRALFQGQPGWGYYEVAPRPSPYALGVFASYGYVPAYAPRPFEYGGAAYLPLRSVADVIGAALLFDLLSDRCVVTYGGVQTVLYIGSPRCYYGNQVVMLSAAPIVCGSVVYVPERLVEEHWRVPVQHSQGGFRLQGERGWHDFPVARAPFVPNLPFHGGGPVSADRGLRPARCRPIQADGPRSHIPGQPRGGGARQPHQGRPRYGLLGSSRDASARPRCCRSPRRVCPGQGRCSCCSPSRVWQGQGQCNGCSPAGSGKVKGSAMAAPRAGSGKVKGSAMAAPRAGSGKAKGGAMAAPRAGSGKAKGGAMAAPRAGSGKAKGGAVAAPRAGSGKAKGGAIAAPALGSGKARGSAVAAPRGQSGKAKGSAVAAPRAGLARLEGSAGAAPRAGSGKAKGGRGGQAKANAGSNKGEKR